jgi:hypothetical protein
VIRRALEVLYGRSPASFEARGSPEEAALSLSHATPSGFLRAGFSSSVVGSVSASRVVLSYHRPFFSNGFAPVFRGYFSVQGGRTVLLGYFALPLFAQGFMTLWFGFVAVFCLGSLVLGPSEAVRGGASAWAGLLAGLSMCIAGAIFGLLGLGFVWFAKRLARNDPERIARHVRECLGAAAAGPGRC